MQKMRIKAEMQNMQETGTAQMTLQLFPVRMVREQEARLSNCSAFRKKLTEKKREALFPVIQEKALSWAVAWVDAEEIDRTDILSARMKAMQLAIDRLNPTADFALIDGNRDRGRSAAIITEHRMIVKGDSLSASIAAASILAKVSRDHWMVRAAEEYPQYQFDRHKGYGTKLHYELLRQYGPSPIHRRSFLKNL